MKTIIIIVALCYLPASSFCQASFLDIYASKDFPCDQESTSLRANICSGERAQFADSLLNRLYSRMMKSLDKAIADNKSDPKTKEYYQRMKQSIINSQRRNRAGMEGSALQDCQKKMP